MKLQWRREELTMWGIHNWRTCRLCGMGEHHPTPIVHATQCPLADDRVTRIVVRPVAKRRDDGVVCRTCRHSKWSTGKKKVSYVTCDVVNRGGGCVMYERRPTIWESVKPWVIKYKWPLLLALGALIFQLVLKTYVVLPLLRK